MSTLARERQSLFSSPNRRSNAAAATSMMSPTSPYSLSNEDMNQLTEEMDHFEEELTTSGRTYEELVRASQQHPEPDSRQNDSIMSEATEESNGKRNGRQSVGFMLGRNSLSNWSTIGGGRGLLNDEEDIPRDVHMEQMNTGRKSNVSRLSMNNMETPNIMSAFHVNVSHRRSNHVNNSRGTMRSNGNTRLSRPSSRNVASVASRGGRRRSNSLNESHISSSSSSGMDVTRGEESLLGESWSPIRSSLENSFNRSAVDNGARSSIGGGKGSGNSLSPIHGRSSNSFSPKMCKQSASFSPIRDRISNNFSPKKLSPVREKSKSPTRRRGLSPKKSPTKTKSRSRSPNRSSSTLSPKRSPMKSKSPVRSPLGDISPNRSPTRVKSPKQGTSTSPKRYNGAGTINTVASPKKKGLSPNGTFSLVEAEGTRLSLPSATAEVEGSDESNMSVSSGSDSEAATSDRLSTQNNVAETVEELPTESTQQEEKHGAAAEVMVPKDDVDMVQSPDPRFAKSHIRSPAPTPNSQRRVMKRFRASVPMANYLMPEDLMEESMEPNPHRLERNPNRKEDVVEASSAKEDTPAEIDRSSQAAKPLEVVEPIEPATYENKFEVPSGSVPIPRIKTLRMFHEKAISNGSPSHQYQLNRAGANRLSLQEVILPSIASEVNGVLKQKQSKAQRNVKDGMPDSQGKEVVKAIETCRKVVSKCTAKAMKAVGDAWRERKKEGERLRLENYDKEKEQKRLKKLHAKKERKEARAHSRQQRYERQKLETQRNHPRNKELWQELTKLMLDIQKLEKEERLWKDALVEVNRLEKHHQPPEKMKLGSIVEEEYNESTHLVKNVENANLESTATILVADVTMATERINWVLRSVSFVMEESDRLRKEAYEKYQYDGHKFYGYPKVDDSKGLFMALSMDSP
eukprot:CAMPEP_0183713582 /NCGR_PEP_ID=MMETSP0737-20130205/8388_1 /TAXON_ID=385413 /ORGANISM="Thalassiosira miniscula, Strain CCMP1093" /LENGTH=913 /DNA_ID=CAMNT_0025942381 /DNA_START=114 /DNA_END=2855 /DNA_ORIENTATION=+